MSRRSAISGEQWRQLLEYFDHRCAYCGLRGPLAMDHIIARNRGGRHELANVVPACRSCNSRKSDRLVLAMVSESARKICDRMGNDTRRIERDLDEQQRRAELRAKLDRNALQGRAVEHALEPSWAEWARHVLNLAACDELGLDPLDRTPIDGEHDRQAELDAKKPRRPVKASGAKGFV